MGKISEFSFKDQIFLTGYRWRRIDPIPWVTLDKPLSECRLGLVCTAGLVLPGQEPFDKSVKGGDYSMRMIPGDSAVSDLLDTHRSRSYDHTGLQRDANLAFPLDRARELVASGRIGSLASEHVSLMGSITAPGRFMRDTAPKAAARLRADGVDVALLVPV
jgi:D-proline reductase (dithiol) PrdB